MIDSLLAAPVAFLIYLMLVGILSGIRRCPGWFDENHCAQDQHLRRRRGTAREISGARTLRFFRVAFFFAVLHLGVLMLGSSGLTPIAGVYLVGLILALVALILG